MPANKRERNVNFSCEETELLLKLVNENKHIVENKKSDAATWHQKENCWKGIEASFNIASSIRYRSAKSLKMKYEAYKRDLKKKLNIRPVICKPEEDSMSDAILSLSEEIVKNVTVYPISPAENRLDSDQAHETGKYISEKDNSDNESHNYRFKLKKKSSRQHSDSSLNKFKNTSAMLTKCKLGIAVIQKQLLDEEFKNKKKQWLFEEKERVQKQKQWYFEEEERAHKRQMWALEKQVLLKKLNLE